SAFRIRASASFSTPSLVGCSVVAAEKLFRAWRTVACHALARNQGRSARAGRVKLPRAESVVVAQPVAQLLIARRLSTPTASSPSRGRGVRLFAERFGPRV